MQSKALTYILLIFLPVSALAVGTIVGLSLIAENASPTSVTVVNTPDTPALNANVSTNTNTTNTTINTNAAAEDDDEKSSLKNLEVDWLPAPAAVDPASIGLKVVDPWAPKGTKVSEAYSVYNVGTIKTAPWKEKRLLLIDTGCFGLCPQVLYRVIDDRGGKGLVFLKNLSNVIEKYDEAFFVQEENYDIPDLHLSATLSVSLAGTSYTLEEEDFSPSVRFGEYIPRKGGKPSLVAKFSHEKAGTLYENTDEGNFYAKNPDGTVKLYRLKFPFTLSDDPDAGHLIQSTSLALVPTSGTLTEGIYTPVSQLGICPPRRYAVYTGIDTKLTKAGTFGAEDFYVTKSASDPLNKDIYDMYIASAQDKTLTLDQFTKDYGVIFWQDGLDRWFRMFQTKYEPLVESECLYINSPL